MDEHAEALSTWSNREMRGTPSCHWFVCPTVSMLTTTIAAGLEKTIGGCCPKGRLTVRLEADYTRDLEAISRNFSHFQKRPGPHLYFATPRRVILLICTTFFHFF